MPYVVPIAARDGERREILPAGLATGTMGGEPALSTSASDIMRISERETRQLYYELKPGDRVEVEHVITVGTKQWTAKTGGTVVRTGRRRHGLHFNRNFDDKVYSDYILLERPDGELTCITVDEYTILRRA